MKTTHSAYLRQQDMTGFKVFKGSGPTRAKQSETLADSGLVQVRL